MIRKISVAIAATLALAACSANTDKATVASAESALTVGGHAVLAYDALPACPLNTPLCRTDAIKAQAKGAFDAAYANVTQAQATVDGGGKPDTVALQAAITALQSVVSMLPKAQ